MSKQSRPKPPEDLQAGAGVPDRDRRKFELVDHELVSLKEACRTIDLLDSLQAAINRDGPLQRWGEGSRAILRRPTHRIALARLFGLAGYSR
jgi:hypothetical protein